jgi:hypothetical protein
MIGRFDGIYCNTPCLIEITENEITITGVDLNERLSHDNYLELVNNGFIEIIY